MDRDRSVCRARFVELVQDALAHLYDHVYLQHHPLAQLLAVGPSAAARGRTLHRLLLEAVGQLQPSRASPHFSTAWRKYQYFILRYVEGQSARAAADELAISERQSRRYHREVLDAVVAILWEMYQNQSSSSREADEDETMSTPGQGREWNAILKEEVARLGASSTDTSTPLAEVLDGVVSAMANLAASRGVQVSVQLDSDLPLVTVDRVTLRQALFSVLMYIIRLTTHDEVVLCGTSDPSSGFVRLRAATTSRTADTSHVNLAEDAEHLEIARQLLADVGGTLNVSHDERGTLELVLRLPCARPTTVLVVDDNPDIIQLFRRYLAGRAYRVLAASNGAEVLEIVRQSSPDIITLDVMVPRRDGWDLLPMLRNLPETRDVPIVVCSVLRERELAFSLGATDFLAKPITQQALLSTLDRHLSVNPIRQTPASGGVLVPPRRFHPGE